MIQVFCARRGTGKTKKLIELANKRIAKSKGDSIYIDDDSRPMMLLGRGIRFVSTEEFGVNDCNAFYGLLCGLIASNYDIENIYIDGLSNIVNCGIKDSSVIFAKITELCDKFSLNMFININCEEAEEIPDIIKEYVA